MTLRLVVSLSHNWSRIDGKASMNGVDLLSMPLDRLLSVVYHWLTDGADQTELQKFDLKLWRPIPGREPEQEEKWGPWSAESETAAFKGLAAALSSQPQK